MPDNTSDDAQRNTITHRVDGSVFDAIRDAGGKADHIIIGDTNHTDLETRSFLSGQDLITCLAEAGVGHLCLEVTPRHQHLADSFIRGDVSRVQFEQAFSDAISLQSHGEVTKADFVASIADSIEHATAVGMDIHFVDVNADASPPPLSSPVSQRIYDVAIQNYETETGLHAGSINTVENAVYALAYNAKEGHITPDTYYQIRAELLQNSRRYDSQTADVIDRETNGEKSAIIYGAAHDDMPTRMAGDVLVVDAYNNGNANNNSQYGFLYEDRYLMVREGREESRTTEGEPDIVHFLGGDTYVTDQADANMINGLTLTEVDLPNGPGVVVPLADDVLKDLPTSLPRPGS